MMSPVDIAKDKADVCIRALSQRQTFPGTSEGRRQLISWLRKHKVTKAVMEASGGGMSANGPGRCARRISKFVLSIPSGCATSPNLLGD